jgi:hypothetical protein
MNTKGNMWGKDPSADRCTGKQPNGPYLSQDITKQHESLRPAVVKAIANPKVVWAAPL